MSRHAIIAVVIGIIIVLGAVAAFLYSRVQQSPTEEATVATQEENSNENGMMASTLVDLLRNQENVRCTFSLNTEEGDSSGTVYVSGENMRGDFELATEDGTEASHMIRSGDTFYMWGDSLNTGIKMVMNIQDWAESVQEPQAAETNTFDPNVPVDFKCSGWTVDSSLFNEPTDVEFVSFGGMMMPTGAAMTDESETSESMSETDTQDQCTICNALTGDAKTVCLQQFSCQ